MRTVAQLVPLRKNKRNFAPIPQLAGKIEVKSDLFGDDSGDWEACDASNPADRFIIATALVGKMPIATAASRFAQYGVEVLA